MIIVSMFQGKCNRNLMFHVIVYRVLKALETLYWYQNDTI